MDTKKPLEVVEVEAKPVVKGFKFTSKQLKATYRPTLFWDSKTQGTYKMGFNAKKRADKVKNG